MNMGLSKRQTLGEEIANAISHGVAGLFGIAGLILLLVKSSNTAEVFSSIVFGFGMILLYLMSTLYHSFRNGSTVKNVFKRFDHIGIYLLIGGTFAPIFILVIDKPMGWILLGVQWAIIILGTIFKAIKINKFSKIHLFLFLLLGWSGFTLIGPLYDVSVPAFYLILAGGISYTIGVLFYAFKWFKFSHFVWHLFVFIGTLLHFLAIYLYLY
jgi:hemolysin III